MRIGIIGGGQLGKMMAQEAKKMGFHVTVLDPTYDCPASQFADEQIVGDPYYSKNELREIVERCDVTTFDIEHVNTEILKELENEGHKINPSPQLLEVIQDKLKQKEVLHKSGVPVPRYEKVESVAELKTHIEKFGFPVVQKARMGGYDGRGVTILKNKNDLEKAIKAESYIEEFVEIEKELAIIVARDVRGEIKCYPVVEMIFDERANILDMVIVPARIEDSIAKRASKIAIKSIDVLEGVGVFGVEMFLTKDGEVLVNEIAPRPHNSGHYTIEACVTSQFEQHIRAISGLPLGSTELLSPAVMVNVLGKDGYKGKPIIEGLYHVLSIPGVCFHFYGKSSVFPFRKMGHVTIIDREPERAFVKAKKIKEILKVKAEVCI